MFFGAEAKFTLKESGWMCQHFGKGSDAYVKRFHEKVLDCCYLVAENMLVDVCLHEVVEDYLTYLETYHFPPSRGWWTAKVNH